MCPLSFPKTINHCYCNNFQFVKNDASMTDPMATQKKNERQAYASISDAQTWEKDKKYVVSSACNVIRGVGIVSDESNS